MIKNISYLCIILALCLSSFYIINPAYFKLVEEHNDTVNERICMAALDTNTDTTSNYNYLEDIPLFVDQLALAEGSINVRNFGAKGDGYSDDTRAIQDAIDYAYARGGGIVYIPSGTYQINADESIQMMSNISLYMSNNAVLRAAPSASCYYDVVLILNAHDVEIIGGSIVGERYEHQGTDGEWGSGISILGSTNIHIADISICNCWGDGIYIGSSWPGTEYYQNFSDNVSIERFSVYNNRRQGISVISARNLTIRDGDASTSNGTRPEAGINLEPNNSTEYLENILIENVMTRYNDNIGILVSLPAYNGSDNILSVNITNHDDCGSPYPISYYKYYESDHCKITVHGTETHNITSFY